MPRVVDHESRRSDIAGALWRVVERDGIAAVSVRSVAKELGHSPSSLRHYFTTQAELMEFALASLLDGARQRLESRIARYDPDEDRIAWLAELFKEGLPLDGRRAAEVEIWMALHRHERDGGSLSQAMRREWRESQQLCRFAVATLAHGAPRDDMAELLDERLELETTLLHTFWDGLTLDASSRPSEVSPELIDDLLTAYLRFLDERLHGGN
ncbi:MAG: TetR family transcriptional regulator C-terminal domain-containing protein [Chloroflexota bacterium]|nr:TetR family transcriptional regulator C-terminal domain-containing protein [Chloroflexota bacterium]